MVSSRKIIIIFIALFSLMLMGCSRKPAYNTTNEYFFADDSAEYVYIAKRFFSEDVEEVTVKSELLTTYEGGSVYSLAIQYKDIPERFFITSDRYDIGTVYVTADNIYLINHAEEIPPEEEFLSKGMIVCSASGAEQNPTDYEMKIEINNDEYKCSFWNPLVETGYYCNMIWTKSKGLTYFRSGFGAERDPIEIELK